MLHLPLSNERHARAVLLQEHLNLSSDSLVGLALAALENELATHYAIELDGRAVVTDADLHAALELCVEHGQHYIEVESRAFGSPRLAGVPAVMPVSPTIQLKRLERGADEPDAERGMTTEQLRRRVRPDLHAVPPADVAAPPTRLSDRTRKGTDEPA